MLLLKSENDDELVEAPNADVLLDSGMKFAEELEDGEKTKASVVVEGAKEVVSAAEEVEDESAIATVVVASAVLDDDEEVFKKGPENPRSTMTSRRSTQPLWAPSSC